MNAKFRSLDQDRAEYAWECVGPEVTKEYVNLAKGAPALIMQNGLMQTLAFYRSKSNDNKKKNKGKDYHGALLGHLVDRLAKNVLGTKSRFDAVMAKLHDSDSATYLLATEEALETLRWIRQYAAARHKDTGEEN